MMDFNKVTSLLGNEDTWENLLGGGIKAILILLGMRVILWITHKAIDKLLINQQKRFGSKVQPRRVVTIGRLLKSVATYTSNFLMIMLMFSSVFGIDIKPFLAGAGIIGLAVGFGAQSLVKDIISGFFIIFEDQFGVEDVIQTGKFKGKVEMIGLRTTRIRSSSGEIHIIPNGLINDVTNYSLRNSIAVAEIQIPEKVSYDTCIKKIEKTLSSMPQKYPEIIHGPEIIGIEKLSPEGPTIRIIAECKATTNDKIVRKIYENIRKTLEEEI